MDGYIGHSKSGSDHPDWDDQLHLDVVARGVADLGEQALLQLLDALFEDADDVLFGIAIAEPSEHDRHLDAMRSLRLARASIREGFACALRNALRGDTSALPGISISGSDADIESATAVSHMTLRGLNANRRALFELEARLDWLQRRVRHAPVSDALSPRVLCAAFQEALAPVRMELSVSLLVYKLFDLQVISRLGPVYLVVNDFLMEQGILPTAEDVLRFAHTKAEQARQRPPARSAEVLAFPSNNVRDRHD